MYLFDISTYLQIILISKVMNILKLFFYLLTVRYLEIPSDMEWYLERWSNIWLNMLRYIWCLIHLWYFEISFDILMYMFNILICRSVSWDIWIMLHKVCGPCSLFVIIPNNQVRVVECKQLVRLYNEQWPDKATLGGYHYFQNGGKDLGGGVKEIR